MPTKTKKAVPVEQVKIFQGDERDVEQRVNAFFSDHPKATVLSRQTHFRGLGAGTVVIFYRE